MSPAAPRDPVNPPERGVRRAGHALEAEEKGRAVRAGQEHPGHWVVGIGHPSQKWRAPAGEKPQKNQSHLEKTVFTVRGAGVGDYNPHQNILLNLCDVRKM